MNNVKLGEKSTKMGQNNINPYIVTSWLDVWEDETMALIPT